MKYSALHAAADFGHVDVCELLLDGAFRTAWTYWTSVTVSLLCTTPRTNGRRDVVELLLDRPPPRSPGDGAAGWLPPPRAERPSGEREAAGNHTTLRPRTTRHRGAAPPEAGRQVPSVRDVVLQPNPPNLSFAASVGNRGTSDPSVPVCRVRSSPSASTWAARRTRPALLRSRVGGLQALRPARNPRWVSVDGRPATLRATLRATLARPPPLGGGGGGATLLRPSPCSRASSPTAPPRPSRSRVSATTPPGAAARERVVPRSPEAGEDVERRRCRARRLRALRKSERRRGGS